MKLNKKQKRTATIASMAALLAVVLGMGGQTFAKYIETETATTPQATVAKFGLVTNVNAMGSMVNEAYTAGVISDDDASTASVLGSDIVVAPGTSGSFALTIDGVAEVRTKLDITTSGNTITCKDGSTIYEPVRWSTDGSSYVTFDEMCDNLEAMSKTSINPGAGVDMDVTISWKWSFDGTDSLPSNNLYDTVLGTAVSKGVKVDTATDFTYDANSTTYQVVTVLNFGISVTLTQIQ